MRKSRAVLAAAYLLGLSAATVTIPESVPPLPKGTPNPAPPYAKNNINNLEGVAPDKGVLNGPVLQPLNRSMLQAMHVNGTDDETGSSIASFSNQTSFTDGNGSAAMSAAKSASDASWLVPAFADKGRMPLAPDGYQFYRNIRDFGAVGDGKTDDTVAINRAAASFSKDKIHDTRCGQKCGSTSTMQALVYFPEGTYLVSSPIVQYYHTQFVGDPRNKPTIKGAKNFSGIALVDNDVYVPDGKGEEWYINQSNFLRQIRSIRFDMRGMPNHNRQRFQRYVPTGIHWQVGQATSITDCDFYMDEKEDTTAVGIMMENGSGGTMADLTFTGGNIGLIAGSQQFTATHLLFESCKTAIKQLWNWGFVYHNLYMVSCQVGIDCTSYSDTLGQGVGSIALIDADFDNVPTVITVGKKASQQPNIVLDKVRVQKTGSVVTVPGGEDILKGSIEPHTITQWVSGYEYLPDDVKGNEGKRRIGPIEPTLKRPKVLLDAVGDYFVRSKPSYEYEHPDSIKVITEGGVKNDGTGDQTDGINDYLRKWTGKLIHFPAGIYQVKGTVFIPPGSQIVGSSWSQIRGTGDYFGDPDSPKAMIQVGNPGDQGSMEISDMLFTVKGNTAGCVLMEWNIREDRQGRAAMWDSHFRVGGAAGSDLQLEDCPAGKSVDKKCQAASMLMHMTPSSSGYFDNVWAWVADHDLDNDDNSKTTEGTDGIPKNTVTQVSVYSARGILIESNGPTWFYGSSSEHSQMYQYQLHRASNIFFGHMQTETPYYQPNPIASKPFVPGKGNFPADPNFAYCDEGDESCVSAWALRVIESRDIVIYGAGFYSFFQNNELGCTEGEKCQASMIETSFSEGLWMFNIFTKGNREIITPRGQLPTLLFDNSTRNGYTSEIAAWLPLALGGGDYGDDDINKGDENDDDGGQNDYSQPCDLDRDINTLEEVSYAEVQDKCKPIIAMKTLSKMLQDTLDEYDDINKNYDGLFKYYKEYVGSFAQAVIDNTRTEMFKYFHCESHDSTYPSSRCDKFFDLVKGSADFFYDVTMTLQDKDGYYADMLKNQSIQEDWITFREDKHHQTCSHQHDDDPNNPCLNYNYVVKGWPDKAHDINVTNPKDIIVGSGDNLKTLQVKIGATYADMALGQWDGPLRDALSLFALPVGLMEQAKESMKEVKDKAEQQKEEDRKKFLENILLIVFTLVPILGEASAAAAGLGALARVFALAGIAADTASGIAQIVQEPESAPLVIAGGILGLGGLGKARTAKGLGELKPKYEKMEKLGQVSKMGKHVEKNHEAVKAITKSCSR